MNLYTAKKDRLNSDVLQIMATAHFLNIQINCKQSNLKNQSVLLETQKGILTQPNAIVTYIAKGSSLLGSNQIQRSQINQWFQFFNIQLYPLLEVLNGAIFGYNMCKKDQYDYSTAEILRVLKIIDECLKRDNCLVGSSLTIIDICLVVNIEIILRLLLTEELRKKYVNLCRWFKFVRNMQPMMKTMGRIILCGKQAINVHFPEPVKKNVDLDQQQQQVQQMTGFQIDQFKRDFVNGDKQKKKNVLQQFFNEFDDAHWSLWKVHHQKDVTEGKIDYMTKNLAKGNLQRLESLRKTGFGSWGVYGVENQYEIRGVFLWKGIQIAAEWKDHPSYTYHTFTKLNSKSSEDKKLIESYWLHEQIAQGLPLVEIKNLL